MHLGGVLLFFVLRFVHYEFGVHKSYRCYAIDRMRRGMCQQVKIDWELHFGVAYGVNTWAEEICLAFERHFMSFGFIQILGYESTMHHELHALFHPSFMCVSVTTYVRSFL